MAETKIEWADYTFNPWTGCTKISPACDNCYAESWAKRSGHVVWGPGQPRRRTTDEYWGQPAKWNAKAKAGGRRYRVFCASLADVFDNEVPAAWRADLFALIATTPHLDWLLLTKRIGNARPMIAEATAAVEWRDARIPPWTTTNPWENVWIGATVCNQEEADRDIPKLLATPAKKRFLSMEPLLGPVDFRWQPYAHLAATGETYREYLERNGCVDQYEALRKLDWIIVGGESGHNSRPMHPDWPRSVQAQCAATGVPFFFKQWGEWGPNNAEGSMQRAGKKANGRILDGKEYSEVPNDREQTSGIKGGDK